MNVDSPQPGQGDWRPSPTPQAGPNTTHDNASDETGGDNLTQAAEDSRAAPAEATASAGSGTVGSGPGEYVSPDGHWRWDMTTAQWVPRNQSWSPDPVVAAASWTPPPSSAAASPAAAPAAALGAAPGAASRSGARLGRRAVVIGAGVLAAAAVVVAVVVSRSGGDSPAPAGQGSDGPVDSSISDRPSACRHEVGSLVDLTVDQGIQALTSVVGSTSPFFGLADNAAVQYKIDLSQYGRSGAQDRARTALDGICKNAGNPILTQAQLTDLVTALGDSPDTDALNQITVFAN